MFKYLFIVPAGDSVCVYSNVHLGVLMQIQRSGACGGLSLADMVRHKEWWGFFPPVIFISCKMLIRDLSY